MRLSPEGRQHGAFQACLAARQRRGGVESVCGQCGPAQLLKTSAGRSCSVRQQGARDRGRQRWNGACQGGDPKRVRRGRALAMTPGRRHCRAANCFWGGCLYWSRVIATLGSLRAEKSRPTTLAVWPPDAAPITLRQVAVPPEPRRSLRSRGRRRQCRGGAIVHAWMSAG